MDQKPKPETLKLVDKNHRRYLDFLNQIPFAQELRPTFGKWGFRKLKSFCTVKEIISGEEAPRMGEKLRQLQI